MRPSVGIILCCLGVFFNIDSGNCKNCDAEIREAQIIPGVADSCGSMDMKIVYPSGVKVNCGNSVSILNTLVSPSITFDKPVDCEYVTVLVYGANLDQILKRLLEPLLKSDEPSKVGVAHWIVHNVPAAALKEGFNGSQGDTKISYLSPLIPIGGHLYNFFVFCQKDKIQKTPPGLPLLERLNFLMDDFQTKNKLGNPIACNFLKLTVL